LIDRIIWMHIIVTYIHKRISFTTFYNKRLYGFLSDFFAISRTYERGFLCGCVMSPTKVPYCRSEQRAMCFYVCNRVSAWRHTSGRW